MDNKTTITVKKMFISFYKQSAQDSLPFIIRGNQKKIHTCKNEHQNTDLRQIHTPTGFPDRWPHRPEISYSFRPAVYTPDLHPFQKYHIKECMLRKATCGCRSSCFQKSDIFIKQIKQHISGADRKQCISFPKRLMCIQIICFCQYQTWNHIIGFPRSTSRYSVYFAA